jgi:photosystem II stability/assembly factor-like uncharacterized protein
MKKLTGGTICSLLLFVAAPVAAFGQTADHWSDVSTAQIAKLGKQPWPGGCAGCAVNRLTGDVMINFVGFGLWKSSDRGQSWTRLDNGVISGRGESGWAVQVDQDDPKRVAVFSLDGDAGYTTDGVHWSKFAGMGRNWDFGSVDWASPEAQVILAGKHESGGEVDKSTDGGKHWTKMSIKMDPQPHKNACMIGVMDANTYIYSNADGIQRSSDGGANWAKVSELQPRSKIPVLFKKAHYLCTSNGLIVSNDKGATWSVQGAAVNIAEGPYFGADEKTMVAAGPKGVFKTTDAGATWTKISEPFASKERSYSYSTDWFGTYTWDPVNNVIYATAMSHPAFKNELPK